MNVEQFTGWQREIQTRTETALNNRLPAAAIIPQQLHEAMRYAVLGGGKRIRALLVHGAGRVTGAEAEALDHAACAVELVHAYSLVHDDMPCMDDDTLRRGKPTVHVAFNQATALLTGDALQTLAFQTLAEHAITDPSTQLEMLAVLARASGSRGMAGGQAIDLASVGQQITREELEYMHIHKTGALIRAAVLLGAHTGPRRDSATLEKLDHFAKLIGLLFQIIDDVLDARSDTSTLGKTAGKDADHNKPTYVSLMGLQQAQALADDLAQQAVQTLAPLGEAAEHLHGITHFIVERHY